MLPHLPAEIRAFALTLRGHGDADRPTSGYRLADYASDVAAFLDALDLDQAVIVGHSMGSSVAQRFALDHPGRCLGLVLIGSVPTWRGNPDLLEVQEALAGMDDPLDPSFVHEFQASTVARPVPESLIATAVAESLLVPAAIWREAFARLLATDFSAELGHIAVPTLLLAGERDELAPIAAQRALEGTIPDTRLIVYPGAGHACHWEDPAQVAADIAAFARALPGLERSPNSGQSA
jgi:pimeloyl-ACP methyl ester carboxylesterase